MWLPHVQLGSGDSTEDQGLGHGAQAPQTITCDEDLMNGRQFLLIKLEHANWF